MVAIDRTRVRTRIVPLNPRVTHCGHDLMYDNGQWKRPPVQSDGWYDFTSTDIWYRKAEACADEVHKGPPWRSGGPFTKIKLASGYSDDSVQGHGEYGGLAFNQFFTGVGYRPVKYIGGFMPLWPSDSTLPVPYRSMWDTNNLLKTASTNSLIPSLASWGPLAWERTAPKIEMSSGYVALAESRDIPHMLKRSAKEMHLAWDAILASGGSGISTKAYRIARRSRSWKQAPREASETFLNQIFGWSPFISDMRKFYNAYQNHAKYMSDMSHGNDKWKVYRRTLANINSDTKIAEGTNWVVYPGSQAMQSQFTGGRPMRWEVRDVSSTLVTSSGRFKWYKPEFDLNNPNYNSAWNTVGRNLTMYGLRVSPSNIWRATPWTWLIDWGFNVGRSIDRIQEQLLDGVVSQYLYVMHHQIRTLVLTCTIPFLTGDVTCSFIRQIDVKQRREAGSPYGFDLSWDTFSPTRLAILAALGITRTSPR